MIDCIFFTDLIISRFVENASLQILKVLKITTLAVKGPSLDVAESTLRRPVRPVGAASIRGSTKEEHCLPLSLNTSSCGIVGEASKENVTLKDHNSLSLSGSISSLNSKPMRAPTPEAKIFPCGASKPSISTGTKTSITKISSSSTKPLSSVPTKMWSSNARIPDMKSFGVASPNPNMITNNLYSSTPKSVLGSASRIMKPSTEHASIRKNIFGAPSKSVDSNTEDTIIKIDVEETALLMDFEETRNTSNNQEITYTDIFLTTEK